MDTCDHLVHFVQPIHVYKADNCVRENKNNSTLKMMCYILHQRGLECTGLLFGRVGHTHGALGVLAA